MYDLSFLEFLFRGENLDNCAQVRLYMLAELAHYFKHLNRVLPSLDFKEKAKICYQKGWRS